MAKIILGIAGEMGSGKDALAKHLAANYGAHTHNFSQILSDIAKRLYLPITRENQMLISGMIRKTFGEDIMAKAMYHDSIEDTADIIVVQGIRRLEDMTFLRQLPNFKLLFVEAGMETRYGRVKKRGEKESDAKLTLEEFKKSHGYETELAITDLKNYAAHVIDNNGTYPDLYAKVDEIVAQYLN